MPNVDFQFLTVVQHMRELIGSCDNERRELARAQCRCTAQAKDPLARGPCNAGAVWLTTQAGEMVDVLEQWGAYRENLIRYTNERIAYTNSLSSDDSSKLIQHLVLDTVTSASVTEPQAHHVTWKHTDWRGQVVPAGEYKLIVEVADYDTAMAGDLAQNAVLELTLDTQTLAAPTLQTQPYFQMMTLNYEEP